MTTNTLARFWQDVHGTAVQPKQGAGKLEMPPGCAVQGWSLRVTGLRFLLLFVALGGSSALADNLSAFTNSLGMRFVSVPKLTNVMFSVWLTRVGDFRHFVADRTNNGGYDYHNRNGLYDMAGNAGAWCEDSYNGVPHLRVWRGGTWNSIHPGHLWLSTRGFDVLDSRYSIVGFRIVISASQ
jgi:hypothetical protein